MEAAIYEQSNDDRACGAVPRLGGGEEAQRGERPSDGSCVAALCSKDQVNRVEASIVLQGLPAIEGPRGAVARRSAWRAPPAYSVPCWARAEPMQQTDMDPTGQLCDKSLVALTVSTSCH
jgi:hypothetical protein